jgi:hypothetical protein
MARDTIVIVSRRRGIKRDMVKMSAFLFSAERLSRRLRKAHKKTALLDDKPDRRHIVSDS